MYIPRMDAITESGGVEEERPDLPGRHPSPGDAGEGAGVLQPPLSEGGLLLEAPRGLPKRNGVVRGIFYLQYFSRAPAHGGG